MAAKRLFGVRKSLRSRGIARIDPMAIIAIEYTYDVAQSELIAEQRPTHRAHLRDLHEAGSVLTFGPLGDDSALILVEADSPEAGLDVLAGDPFRELGVIKNANARVWNPAVNPWA